MHGTTDREKVNIQNFFSLYSSCFFFLKVFFREMQAARRKEVFIGFVILLLNMYISICPRVLLEHLFCTTLMSVDLFDKS